MTAVAEFQVQLPSYTGTLEGLVSAVSCRELAVSDLPLGPLAHQLLRFLESQGLTAGLDRPMEWAELAARLIRWKTLVLLPDAAQQVTIEAELRQEVETNFRELERQRVEQLRDFLSNDCWCGAACSKPRGKSKPFACRNRRSSLPCGPCDISSNPCASAPGKGTGRNGCWPPSSGQTPCCAR